jgi:hypothetical protein
VAGGDDLTAHNKTPDLDNKPGVFLAAPCGYLRRRACDHAGSATFAGSETVRQDQYAINPNHMNENPMPLTSEEWDEVARVSYVRECLGLQPSDDVPCLRTLVYAAKFAFESGGPGYVGDLVILMGDALSAPPLVLARDSDGQLEVVDFDF